MKKAFLFPLLALSFALPSCGNSPAESSNAPTIASSTDSTSFLPANMAEVNKLKELLAKQDLSPVYTKMFTSLFSQDYEAYFSSNGTEEEKETRFYTYHGAGWFGCLYEVSEEAYAEAEALGNPDFFDYLARGIGSYGMIQQGSLVSYIREKEEEKVTSSLQHLEFTQDVEARFTDENVQVINSMGTKPTIGEGGYNASEMQSFNGIIAKETLFDAITVRAFSDIFARTNLFDGQRTCETLDRIYLDTVRKLDGASDLELSRFIDSNGIRIESKDENTLVHFALGDQDLRDTMDEYDIIPGTFEGTLIYETESGKFASFEYGIRYVSNEPGEDSDTAHAISMEFKASGYSWNQKYGQELYIDPNPTVYEDAETFLEDVVREVIPPLF